MKLFKTFVLENDDFCANPFGESMIVNGVCYNACMEPCNADEMWEEIEALHAADPRNVDLQLFSEPESERFVYYDMGNFGFKDSRGKTVIEPQFPTAREFSYGFAAVCVACSKESSYPLPALWNFVDPAGVIQFKEDFKWARDFNRYNVALVRGRGDTYFLVNKKRIKVPNSEFPCVEALSEGGWEFDGDYRYLLYSYSDVKAERDYACGAEPDVLFGIYDTADCTVLCPPIYRSVEAVVPGVFCVRDAKGNTLLVDKKGSNIGFVTAEDGTRTELDVASYSWRGVGDYIVAWDRASGIVAVYEQEANVL